MANQNPGATATVAQGPANPTAFWLSLAGVVIQGIAAIMIVTMFSVFSGFGGMMGGYYGGMMWSYARMPWFGWMSGVWLVTLAAGMGLGIFGLMWMGSRDTERIRGGAIIVLIAAVVSFPTMWGFGIGSILMLVGAILALTTIPSRVQT